MRCRDAKKWLAAQRDGDLAQSDVMALQEHLKQCPTCHAAEQRQQRLNTLLRTATPMAQLEGASSSSEPGLPIQSISTERIMLAVQQQRRITQQLEDIRTQQQFRIARWRVVGPSLAAIIFFTLGSIPLLLLAIAIVQPDLLVNTLSLLSDGIGVLVALAPYLQAGLAVVTRNNWLLASIAFIFVVMMGMWLRLMRYPQEA